MPIFSVAHWLKPIVRFRRMPDSFQSSIATCSALPGGVLHELAGQIDRHHGCLQSKGAVRTCALLSVLPVNSTRGRVIEVNLKIVRMCACAHLLAARQVQVESEIPASASVFANSALLQGRRERS